MPQTEGLAPTMGGELYYQRRGDGTPVVLIHGGFSDLSFWDYQFGWLSERYDVIRYDLRGHGRSSEPTGPYSHHEDLIGLLDRLGIGQVCGIGLSYGGGILLDAAVTFPERFLAVVPVDASPVGGYQWVEKHPALPAIRAFRDGGLEAAKATFLSLPLCEQAMLRPHAMKVLQPMVSAYAGWMFLNADPVQVPDPPTIEQLASITAPTMAMVGEHDGRDLRLIAELVAGRVPGAVKEIIAGCGHLPPVEEPELFNRLIDAFLCQVLSN